MREGERERKRERDRSEHVGANTLLSDLTPVGGALSSWCHVTFSRFMASLPCYPAGQTSVLLPGATIGKREVMKENRITACVSLGDDRG